MDATVVAFPSDGGCHSHMLSLIAFYLALKSMRPGHIFAKADPAWAAAGHKADKMSDEN